MAIAKTPAGRRGLVYLAWRFLCSVKLALILILLLAAATLIGTFLVQAPFNVDYDLWLNQVRPKYGALTDVLSALQFFNIFNSLWYRSLVGVLMVSVVACTVNRWPATWRTVAQPRVRVSEGFFRSSRNNATLASAGLTAEGAGAALQGVFGRRRYRTLTETDGQVVYLYADKNRFGKLGTFLNHLSLLLILAGALIGGIFGFREDDFVVPEGSTRQVGLGTDLSLRVESFTDEYYPSGQPKDYRTEAVLLEKGVEVQHQTIRVNEPLIYKGIRFHQAFFGQAAVLRVKDEKGDVLFDDGIALAWRWRDRPMGSFLLPSQGLVIYVVGPMPGGDPVLAAGEVMVWLYQNSGGTLLTVDNLVQGEPKLLEELEFTFQRERQFTGLQVVKDPGVPLVWIASALMIVGICMVFYLPHRRAWALCRPLPEGAQVLLATATGRDGVLEGEFADLVAEVRRALGAHQVRQTRGVTVTVAGKRRS